MNAAVDDRYFSGGLEGRLWGPKMLNRIEWAQMMRRLEQGVEVGDMYELAVAWILASDLQGGGASVNWRPGYAADAVGDLMSGYCTDSLEAIRRDRWQQLHRYIEDVPGLRAAVIRELVSRDRFIDNRATSLKEVKAVIRALLGTGGRFIIAPEQLRLGHRARFPVEPQPDTDRFSKGNWSEIDHAAQQAAFRLAQRWRAQPLMERMVRKVGTVTDNGWVVLEGMNNG